MVTALPGQNRRKHQTAGRAAPAIALSIIALAIAACSSRHQLAEQQTTAASAEANDARSQTVSPRVPERRTRPVVYCEDLEVDPLRGLAEQDSACIPVPPRTSTSEEECRDICIDAVIVEVDEDHWEVIRVEVLKEKGGKTPAIVHRTAGYPATGPEVGKRVEFTCTYRYDDDHGMLHYGDCYQGPPEERSSYELDEMTGPGDVGGYELL